MTNSFKVVVVLATCLLIPSCSEGSAKVRQAVPSPSGERQAVLLFQDGGIDIGRQTYVAIFDGNAPPVDSMHKVRDLCVVWTAYRATPWKLTWEGEEQVSVAVNRRLPSDYERMVKQKTCGDVSSRWYYEAKAPPSASEKEPPP